MKVKELYDQLSTLESRFLKKESYPIHKKLIFKNEDYKDLNDWLIDRLILTEDACVLDAGCGTGRTLFKIADKKSIIGLGISLSSVEIDLAKSYRLKNNYLQINFSTSSFDENLRQKFDLIIAIESIKHSINYKKTIRNLASHLKPGGEFWIIEDVRNVALDLISDTKNFMDWWDVPYLFDKADIEESAINAGLQVKETYDLTSKMNQSSLKKAKGRIRVWNILRRFMFGKKAQNNTRTFLAGFILDQWYLENQMDYFAFRFVKNAE